VGSLYTLIGQRILGDTTHKIQNIEYIYILNVQIFFLGPKEMSDNIKLFFATYFPLLPVLGFKPNDDLWIKNQIKITTRLKNKFRELR